MKKLIVYPYNIEAFHITRFSDQLKENYELLPVLDYNCPNDKTANFFDCYSSNEISVYNFNDLENICATADAIYLTKPINVNSNFNLPNFKGLDILYDYRKCFSCKPDAISLKIRRGSKKTPNILHFSLSTFTDKKIVQLKLMQIFSHNNVNVHQISSMPDSHIFGLNSFPIEYIKDKSYYENFLYDLQWNSSYDLTMCSIPGGAIDGAKDINNISLIKDIYNKLNPEIVIVNIPFCNNMSEVKSTVNIIRQHLHINPTIIIMSNIVVNWQESDFKKNLYEFYTIRTNQIFDELSTLMYDGIKFYNIYNENDSISMYNYIIERLHLTK